MQNKRFILDFNIPTKKVEWTVLDRYKSGRQEFIFRSKEITGF